MLSHALRVGVDPYFLYTETAIYTIHQTSKQLKTKKTQKNTKCMQIAKLLKQRAAPRRAALRRAVPYDVTLHATARRGAAVRRTALSRAVPPTASQRIAPHNVWDLIDFRMRIIAPKI